jgi:ornithine cyclodeaminase
MFDYLLDYDAVLSKSDIAELGREIEVALEHGSVIKETTPSRELLFKENSEDVFLSMPALSEKYGLYTCKLVSIFDRQESDELETVNALMVAYSSKDGRPIAIMDGSAITNIKCAGITAAVTNYCAIDSAKVLAVIGAGVQARQQIAGVLAVRDICDIRIYSRTLKNTLEFAAYIESMYLGRVKVNVCSSVEEAIETADIISTTTTSTEPLSDFHGLKEHVHMNCMGAHTETSREIPNELLENSILVVEDIETAILEAGHLHSSAKEIFSLPNMSPSTLKLKRTIFSSTGHSFLDLLACRHVLSNVEI